MKFLKILALTIIIICMVTALVYGVVDIIELVTALGNNAGQQVQNVAEGAENISQAVVNSGAPISIWADHLREITFSGLSLSVLFMGWKSIMDYCKEKNI